MAVSYVLNVDLLSCCVQAHAKPLNLKHQGERSENVSFSNESQFLAVTVNSLNDVISRWNGGDDRSSNFRKREC